MNILFLPSNIASIPSITAAALNKLEGINAVSITGDTHKYQSPGEATILLPKKSQNIFNPFAFIYSRWKYWKELKKWMEWADVLHYVWGPAFSNGADVRWARSRKKVIIIEWVGSDIRDPEILFKINPYYTSVFNNGYEYKKAEQTNNKIKVQELFAKANAVVAISPEISLYLNKNLFREFHLLFQRLDLKNFVPQYPSVNNARPLIIHSPSAKIAKGSNFIVPLIETLKKDYDFDFILLHDMSREKVLELMQKADIFLDQLIFGGYGMATTEAMAFGKPVMCYIMPEVFDAGLPSEFPIVNTNPKNLKEQLIKLIQHPQLRYNIGKQSRAYAEKYFDADKIALQLLEIYKSGFLEKCNTNA